MGSLQRAAAATGVDFGYLVRCAQRESSLNPSARARFVLGGRPVPVHRADLARHAESQRRQARLRRFGIADRARAGRPLFGARSAGPPPGS
ncbi:MAG: hypothetical protein WDN06_00720 [Asticcacaulis sp.]